MRYILFFMFIVAFLLDVLDNRIAVITSAIIFAISYEVYRYYIQVLELRQFGARTQNIYVVGLHKSEPYCFENIDKYILDLIVFVEHENTEKEVKYQKSMLLESENKLYKHYDKNPLSELHFIRVKRFNFKEHRYFNENWKEYQERIILDIQKSSEKQNEALYKYEVDYYEQFALQLSGVKYKPKGK